MRRLTRPAMLARTLAAMACLGCVLPALASEHIIDIAWDANGRFGRAASVAAGKFVEVCGEVKSGDAVRWSFQASAPLDFNVHYHVGKATEYPARMAQTSMAEGELRASVKETHCWMWTNKSSQPVRVELKLQR